MIRFFGMCAALWVMAFSWGVAQTDPSSARVVAAQSSVSEGWFGRTTLQIALTKGAPFRVFTLDQPKRLVVDFRDLDWSGVAADQMFAQGMGLKAARFGTMQPGWSRLVADMSRPMRPEEVGMSVDEKTGAAVLKIVLEPVSEDVFAATAGTPASQPWPTTGPPYTLSRAKDGFVVVIDPGHGGIDPGAERDGLSEKVLMLDIAMHLKQALERTPGVSVVLTRSSDVFVSLERRVAVAHHVGADVFVSLHADALSEGGAQGATVYTLSEEASDTASAYLAERHNRTDIIAGLDLRGTDDDVTQVLLELARQETDPRSDTLARALVQSMTTAGGPMNRRPLRYAGFSVLKSADVPSVLVEVGFLSSKRDLENLRDPDWRTGITEAMAQAILSWRSEDAAMRTQMRH